MCSSSYRAVPFADRTLSAASMLQRIASAASVDHLDPASDESLDSGRLQIRSHSIPNGVLASELEPLNNNHKHGASFTMGGHNISITTTAPSIPNLTSINERTNSGNSINSSNYSNNNSLSTLNIGGGGGGNGGGAGGTSSGSVSGMSSGGVTIVPSSGNGRQKQSNPRRLSIKQDQLPIDSMC